MLLMAEMIFHLTFEHGLKNGAKNLLQDVLYVFRALDVVVVEDLLSNLLAWGSWWSFTLCHSVTVLIFVYPSMGHKVDSCNTDLHKLFYTPYENMIYTQLRMPNIQDTSSKTLISFIKSVQDLPTPFSTLLTILSGITNNSIDALKNTMSLISRVYLGPELFETITNKTAFPAFTIIYCNNPLYVKKFLEDLFFFYTRSYSLYSLANKENIPKFIKNKLVGILANIDCSESSFTDLSQFQKLIKGNLISVYDESLSKISHRSTLYYIYITSNKAVAEKQFNSCNYHTIELTGDLTLGKYKQLALYEIILFSLASVFWWTNAYITKAENDQNSSDISENVESISLTTNQKIDQFLSEF